jgi:hypothetical protein
MGLKTKTTININIKRTNRIQDDDVNQTGKQFWRERKKTTFLIIFSTYLFKSTEISSVGTRWMWN